MAAATAVTWAPPAAGPAAAAAPDTSRPSSAKVALFGAALGAIGTAVAAGAAGAAGAVGAATEAGVRLTTSTDAAEPSARRSSLRSAGRKGSKGSTDGGPAPSDFELSSMEAALEAWAACQPEGCTLPASAVPDKLKDIAGNVPRSWLVPETEEMLKGLFEAGGGSDPPVFQQLLKVRGDRVHFLDFWRAFSKATHLLTSLCCNGIASDGGLAMELETVRDGILRLLEAQDGKDGASETLSLAEVVQNLQNAAAMSQAPDFWKEAEDKMREKTQQEKFSLEDLGEVMLLWLQMAIVSQSLQMAERQGGPEASETGSEVGGPEERGGEQKKGTPVYLHIYDVSQEEGVRKLNKVLAHRYSPLKFGGVFHAGVEVNGLEWSYGMSLSETVPGLSCVLPKTHPNHTYRQTVRLHRSKLSAETVAELIGQMAEEYPGHDYHLLRRNCCHFADDLCQRIGAGRIPGWVHRLARVGANVDAVMHRVMNRRLLPDDESDCD